MLDYDDDESTLSFETLFSHDDSDLTAVAGPVGFKPRNMGKLLPTSETGFIALSPECDQQLATLNVQLSQQLQEWAQEPDPTVGTSYRRRTEETGHYEVMRKPSLFGDALRGVSKFSAIVQSYGSRPTTIIVVLQLLTAYLSLVSICDYLFVRIHHQLNQCDKSKSRGGDIQTLPGLQLAGVSVQQGELQTKILTQAVLHHFEAIEQALGLPAEICVLDPHGGQKGLLSDERGQNLMTAIMNGMVSDSTGLGALPSLRGRINHIRVFLRF
ncbi:hypothetical protein SCUP234_13401 [Seiridium cupressi]